MKPSVLSLYIDHIYGQKPWVNADIYKKKVRKVFLETFDKFRVPEIYFKLQWWLIMIIIIISLPLLSEISIVKNGSKEDAFKRNHIRLSQYFLKFQTKH